MTSRGKSGQQRQGAYNAGVTYTSREQHQQQFTSRKEVMQNADTYSDDDEPQPAQSIPTQKILIFSRGVFEGSRICNALFGEMAFRSSSGEPETRTSIIENKTTVITNMPLMVGQQNERDIIHTAKQCIGQTSYTAVVVVLKLPERATPETETYYRIIRNIVGQSIYRNTMLIFTNAATFKEDSRRFQNYLSEEILSSKKRGFPRDALGSLIKAVHNDKETNQYDHCLLFDEKNETTHDELLHKAGELNHSFNLADSRNESLKSSLMILIIIILLGLVIKLSYDNYTRAYSKWEEMLKEKNLKIDDLNFEIQTLGKTNSELMKQDESLQTTNAALQNDLKVKSNDYDKMVTVYEANLKDKETEIQTCELAKQKHEKKLADLKSRMDQE